MEGSTQLHDPVALLQGKSPWYPLDRRLGGHQSQSGRGGEKFPAPPRTRTHHRPARSLALYHWAVSALNNNNNNNNSPHQEPVFTTKYGTYYEQKFTHLKKRIIRNLTAQNEDSLRKAPGQKSELSTFVLYHDAQFITQEGVTLYRPMVNTRSRRNYCNMKNCFRLQARLNSSVS
jgi:hypothetical protein